MPESFPPPDSAQLSGWQVYQHLLGYSLAYWPILSVSLLTMVLTAATETGFAALMRPLMDGSFVARDPDLIRWIPLAILGLFIVRGVAEFVSNYTMKYVGRQVVKTLRERLFWHLLHMPVGAYDNTPSGLLVARLTYHVEQVAGAATDSLTILVRDTLTVLGLLGWMLYLNWRLTLAVLIIAPLVAIVVSRVTRRFRRLSRRIQSSMGDVTQVANEVIDGQREVKIFNGQAYEQARFDQINERNRRLHMKLVAAQSGHMPLVQFIVALALALIVWLATLQPTLESISVGTFVSFITAMLLLLTPVRRLTNVNVLLQKGIAAGQNIFALLASPTETDLGKQPLQRARGHIEFRQVEFAYTPAQGAVLHDITLTLQPGETVALVGRSGSGKTTLASLLPRFYRPQHGSITLDGIPIEQYRLHDLRAQIAYVGQHVTLFDDTLAHNIAYGQRGPEREARIQAAAEAAYAMEFINALPHGLQTRVGENGILLSGGQRQRIALARAFCKDAPILILDEATSALDTESERYIQAAMENLRRNRTTLVIAHRLSTIESADRIAVMQQGRIVELGTHQQLLDQEGVYARLYRLQFNTEAPASGLGL